MKIIILVIGKEKDFSSYELVREYTDRISHYCACEFRYVPGVSFKEDNEKIIEILARDISGSYVIALDEIGKEYDSESFSKIIESRMNESVKNLYFVIGGSYGLNEEIRNRANLMIALSKLTFPHQLVRLVLVEQLYRAFTIIKGEKYHH